jgi:DeoR family transcriptional regulator, aga operon transcriptional repressor
MRWAGAYSLIGPAAIETLSIFVLDRLFLGVTGMDPERGATKIEPEEAARDVQTGSRRDRSGQFQ